MKVAIITNNIECERHTQYYSKIKKYFLSNNWEISPDFNSVDKIVICGCGFHDFMYQKIKKILGNPEISRLADENIIIMGCSPKTHESQLKKIFAGHIIELNKEHILDSMINADIPFQKIEEINIFNSAKNKIFYIKIESGCLQGCSFCVIKKAKGYIKSVPLDKIIKQFEIAVKQGYKKIFLMGEDTFAYGFDIGTNIIHLVKKLLTIDQKIEFYFGSLHSRWLKQYSQDIILLTQKGLIKKLHIGLQHVNDRLLKKMGRSTAFSETYKTVLELRNNCPDLYLSVEVIVGFPGETEEEFNELVKFFQKDKCFNHVSHFGYSDLREADSFNLDGKIDALQIAKRWDHLKKTLGERSFYNSDGSPDNYGTDFRLTLEQDFFVCQKDF